MSTVLDQVRDVNYTGLHRIQQLVDLPDFVKKADWVSPDDAAQLPRGAFADPGGRSFPIHNRAQTFLSYAYFLHGANGLNKESAAKVYGRLKAAARDWGIETTCARLEDQHAKQSEFCMSRLPDDQFALVADYDGKRFRRFPLLNASCVKSAAEHLSAYKANYPLAWRKSMARKILGKAAAMGVNFSDDPDLSGYLTRAAAVTPALPGDMANGMEQRLYQWWEKKAYGHRASETDHEVVRSMKQAIATVRSARLPNRELSVKCASALDEFDKFTGECDLLDRDGLAYPEEIAYTSMQMAKEASELASSFVTLPSGNSYRMEDIRKAGAAPFQILGDEFLSAVTDIDGLDMQKVAEIVPTLPLPDAQILDRALVAAGVPNDRELLKRAGFSYDMLGDEEEWRKAMENLGHKSNTSSRWFIQIDLSHPQEARK